MLNWDQIHWLKLLSVMAASVSQNFESSIELICELLTEDAEGGSNSIPFWMFNICYAFLAELDCSVERKITSEKIKIASITPTYLSSKHFRDAILNQWKRIADDQSLKHLNLTSNYKFDNIFDGIKQSTNFENIILLMKDIQFYKPSSLHEVNERPSVCNDVVSLRMHEEVVRLVGAPWNWMYEFAQHNCSKKSYNFIEHTHNKEIVSVSNLSLTSVGDDELNRKVPADSFALFGDEEEASDKVVKDEDKSDADHSFKMENTFSCSVPVLPGIGRMVSATVVHNFLDCLKYRSINENGLVFPRHFKELQCPSMT